MKENPRSKGRMLMRALRVVLICGASVWGCYILLALRTMGWGGSIRSLAATVLSAGLFVLPIALIACVSRNWQRMLLHAAILSVVAVALCETTATVEEYLFRRECATVSDGAETVFKNRWWPFEHHYVYYHPSTQTFGGGD